MNASTINIEATLARCSEDKNIFSFIVCFIVQIAYRRAFNLQCRIAGSSPRSVFVKISGGTERKFNPKPNLLGVQTEGGFSMHISFIDGKGFHSTYSIDCLEQ